MLNVFLLAGNANYQTCGEIATQAEKRTGEGMKAMIKKIGKRSFDALIGVGVSEAVRTALSTILGI